MKILMLICVGFVFAVVSGVGLLALRSPDGSRESNDPWWRNVRRLTVGHSAGHSEFGNSVALDGGCALVGTLNAADHGLYSGAAGIFQQKSPGRTCMLGAQDTEPGGEFGMSVAICGKTALIGKPGDSTAGANAGAALVYREDGHGDWRRVAKLVASDARPNDQFGNCVAMQNGIALVGTRGPYESGTVYVFQEGADGSWRQLGKLVPDQQSADDGFGWPIAIDGDRAIVGAHAANDNGKPRVGAVCVFQRNESGDWPQCAELIAPNARTWERFGSAVALRGKTAVIGAPGSGDNRGAIYVFQEDVAGRWNFDVRIAPRDIPPMSCFGNTVAINDQMFAVGAPREDLNAGAVYLYQKSGSAGWTQNARLTHIDALEDCWFGSSVALDEKHLLVGARSKIGKSVESCDAYLFELSSAPTNPHLVTNPESSGRE